MLLCKATVHGTQTDYFVVLVDDLPLVENYIDNFCWNPHQRKFLCLGFAMLFLFEFNLPEPLQSNLESVLQQCKPLKFQMETWNLVLLESTFFPLPFFFQVAAVRFFGALMWFIYPEMLSQKIRKKRHPRQRMNGFSRGFSSGEFNRRWFKHVRIFWNQHVFL